MRSNTTYIWGVAADQSGLVQHTHYHGQELAKSPLRPKGGMRAWKTVETEHEPASAYANVHNAPLPMKWTHADTVGRVVALRRQHQRLYAVAETEELEPDQLAWLTKEYGEIKMSTSTNNRRNELLRIDEISLTPSPASIGLPPVRWYKLDVTKGNMPMWVKEELKRADKLEVRQRLDRELQVHDVDYERNPYSDPERYKRDLGLVPGADSREAPHGYMNLDGERVPMEYRPGRIISVGGRKV